MGDRTWSSYERDFRFLVLTGEDTYEKNVTVEGSVCFSKISGIELAMETEEIMEGGKNDGPHLLHAPHKRHQPIVLERGVISKNSWMSRLKPGMRLGTWLLVILLTDKGEWSGRRFGINDGTVSKWELAGLDAMGRSILVERMEIIHDGIIYQ